MLCVIFVYLDVITILVTVCIRGTTNNRIAVKRLLMIPHSHSWDCVKFDGISKKVLVDENVYRKLDLCRR